MAARSMFCRHVWRPSDGGEVVGLFVVLLTASVIAAVLKCKLGWFVFPPSKQAMLYYTL